MTGNFGVVTYTSFTLDITPPIIAGTNNRNLVDSLNIKEIAVHADKQRARAGDRRSQYWNVRRISAQVCRQVGGHYDHSRSPEESGDLISLTLREMKFLYELSTQLLEDIF
jgi:hypothetical protein